MGQSLGVLLRSLGTLYRVDKLLVWLTLVLVVGRVVITGPQSHTLEVGAVGGTAHFTILVLPRHPHFKIVFVIGWSAQLSCGHLQDSEEGVEEGRGGVEEGRRGGGGVEGEEGRRGGGQEGKGGRGG